MLKYLIANVLVIRSIEDHYSIVGAHCPELFHDLDPHFLSLGYRRVATFNGVFDIADALISELNQSDISSHDFFLSCGCALNYSRSLPAQKINVLSSSPSEIKNARGS